MKYLRLAGTLAASCVLGSLVGWAWVIHRINDAIEQTWQGEPE